jgi:nucleoid-associated protein YgaU
MKRLLALLILCAALTGPAAAQSLDEALEEARLVSRIKIALAEDDALRAFTFEPTADDGVVTLRGTVRTAAQKRRVDELVGALDGVERVVNDVQVAAGQHRGASELPPVEPEPEPVAEEEESEPESEPEEVYHTVRRGDSLIAIARRYGVSVDEIRRLNGIRGSNIRIGQRLRVK